MKKTTTTAVGAVLGASLLLVGCSAGGDASSAGKTEITGAFITDPTTFDPTLSTALDDFRFSRLMYDTVVRRDDDNQIVGGLASSWSTEPSHVELVIRDDATCADGTPITASVVAASLARLADPATKANMRGLIFGGPATVNGDDATGTVTIDLDAPYAELLMGLTVPSAGIICPAGLADLDGLAAGEVPGAISGPYSLASAQAGVGYELELREDYAAWPEYAEPLEGRPAETISVTVGTTNSANANQVLTGGIDFGEVSYQDLDRVTSAGIETQSIPVGDYFIVFNEAEGSPFADEEKRRAVAQAIDAAAFAAATKPDGELLLSMADPGVQCVNTESSLLVEQDLEAARAVLEGTSFRLIGTTAVGNNGAGNVYVQEALRAVGADVQLENTDTGTWVGKVLGPDTAAWDMTVFASVNNPGTLVTGITRFLGAPIAEGGRNMSSAVNPEGEAAYAEALSSVDDVARCDAYQTAQETILDRVDLVPLSVNPENIATAAGIALRSPGGREDFSTIRIVD